jgi:TPP-dependent pyruvate/acetoin dehydrogenase alpha subunit
MTATRSLERRADAYGFPGVAVDGMDALAVHAAVRQASARARAGGGPSLLVASCYRYAGHFSGDLMRYREAAESEPWLARDPIVAFANRLVGDGFLSETDASTIGRETQEAVAAALEFAKASPWPDHASVWEDVVA